MGLAELAHLRSDSDFQAHLSHVNRLRSNWEY